MGLFDIVVLFLATRAVLDVWFWEDSILASWRAITQTWQGRLKQLFNCRFCFSHHVAFWLTLIWVSSFFLGELWSQVARVPIYSLAVINLISTVDQLVHYFFPESGDEKSGP